MELIALSIAIGVFAVMLNVSEYKRRKRLTPEERESEDAELRSW